MRNARQNDIRSIAERDEEKRSRVRQIITGERPVVPVGPLPLLEGMVIQYHDRGRFRDLCREHGLTAMPTGKGPKPFKRRARHVYLRPFYEPPTGRWSLPAQQALFTDATEQGLISLVWEPSDPPASPFSHYGQFQPIRFIPIHSYTYPLFVPLKNIAAKDTLCYESTPEEHTAQGSIRDTTLPKP